MNFNLVPAPLQDAEQLAHFSGGSLTRSAGSVTPGYPCISPSGCREASIKVNSPSTQPGTTAGRGPDAKKVLSQAEGLITYQPGPNPAKPARAKQEQGWV